MKADERGGAAEAEETAYYQTIEEFFVSRRGDPLFLSNADWLLIRKWREAGTPLRVVLRGIADALDGHAHSWSRKRKVGSLAYCSGEVDAARDRWRRALALGEEPGVSVASALLAFAEALAAARGLGVRGVRAAASVARELRDMAQAASEGPRDLERLTGRLHAAEAELLAAIVADTGPTGVRAIEADVAADLTPYSGRMPARVLDQIRAESVARRLLEAHGLPRLSLFHL